MWIRAKLSLIFWVGFSLLDAGSVFAQEQIIRQYQSTRASGMGGVLITTGLWDENFFGNPARVTDNPHRKFQVVDLTLETTGAAITNAGNLLQSGNDAIGDLGDTAGRNNHLRIQTVFPAFYIPNWGKMSYAFALIQSTQADFALRRSYQMSPMTVLDIGPAITVGRKFLTDDALAVGVTAAGTYRFTSEAGYTLIDFLQGKSLSPSKTGGDGGHVDFTLGSTYRLPVKWRDWTFTGAIAVNNLLGGRYQQFGFDLAGGRTPIGQPRAFSFGMSASRKTIWKLSEVLTALEFQNIGNNGPYGTIFRLIHWGTEARYKHYLVRVGLNQGYLTAGVGLQFRLVSLDLSTYGEERSYVAGGLQDRRFALKFGFSI